MCLIESIPEGIRAELADWISAHIPYAYPASKRRKLEGLRGVLRGKPWPVQPSPIFEEQAHVRHVREGDG